MDWGHNNVVSIFSLLGTGQKSFQRLSEIFLIKDLEKTSFLLQNESMYMKTRLKKLTVDFFKPSFAVAHNTPEVFSVFVFLFRCIKVVVELLKKNIHIY